jgi:hypothetical protein
MYHIYRVYHGLYRAYRRIACTTSIVRIIACIVQIVHIVACITRVVHEARIMRTVRTLRKEYKVCNLRTLRHGTVVG